LTGEGKLVLKEVKNKYEDHCWVKSLGR